MNKQKRILVRDGVELSALYFPLLAITPLIEETGLFNSINLAVFSGIICFLVNLSVSHKAAMKKWGLSCLITIAFWAFLSISNFNVRLVNMMYPGYGRISAGGGFAFFFDFIVFSMADGIGCLLAMVFSGIYGSTTPKPLEVIKDFVLPVICGGILLMVFCLTFIMPSWDSVY